jgi:hypothetical protein
LRALARHLPREQSQELPAGVIVRQAAFEHEDSFLVVGPCRRCQGLLLFYRPTF